MKLAMTKQYKVKIKSVFFFSQVSIGSEYKRYRYILTRFQNNGLNTIRMMTNQKLRSFSFT